MFKKRAVLAVIVSLIVVGSTTFGTLTYLEARDFRIYLQNQYERTLYNLITDVEQIQVSMSKVPVTSSQKQSLLMFGDVWRQANSAQEKLNALPIAHSAISQTSKYLSQVGDFCYTLLKASNRGESLDDSQWVTVEKLGAYSGNLSAQLRLLSQEVAQGKLDWGVIRNQGNEIFSQKLQNPVDVKFEKIAESMQQYPTLIYDGPFAENVLNIKPKILSEAEVTQDRAKEIATNIVGKDKVESINVYSDKTGDKVPAYAFTVKVKGQKDGDISIDISKNGGKVVYMLDSRNVGQPKLSMQDAINKGSEYLESIGFADMIPTFSLRYDNTAVINYVYVKDRVVVYPDQIKIKVALDNGDVTGIESQHYLVAHSGRETPQPRISVENAKKNVSQKLSIKNQRLSIIPMESMREVFCYEFYGEYNGEEYIVYINALDGVEERILKLIATPNGELTM
jgi:spore germination protein